MRPYALLPLVATSLLATPIPSATAQEAAGRAEPAEEVARDSGEGVEGEPSRPVPAMPERLLVDDRRLPPPPLHDDRMSVAIHGEYQLRFRAFRDFRLTPAIGEAGPVTSGRDHELVHWHRFRPAFYYRKNLVIAGEIDIPRGFVAGPTTRAITAARDDRQEREPWLIQPRQLYLQYLTPIGMVKVGQQTSHWGMGILANDGDHPTVFGDYRRGSLVERLLFATRPAGEGSPFVVAAAGDVVFEDPTADLVEGDRAFQGVLALRYEHPRATIGAYGVVRHQERDAQNLPPGHLEHLTVGVADLAASFNLPLDGGYFFGEAEAALIKGQTTFLRSVSQTQSGAKEQVQSFGGAAKLGFVLTAEDAGTIFGRLVVAAEYGYASGDADPYDGTTRRFTFDQNHNVGLVLFDHLLATKTARSATIAADPNLAARPAPGLDLLPSEGAIFGASYLNPTAVIRPMSWLDLELGVVVAQTTADFVDPYRTAVDGSYVNFDGGSATNHDLGVELDAGIEVHYPLTNAFVISGGAEGGLLFPGRAFDDAQGTRLPNQYLLNSKLGVRY
ncbi:MAG: hypothetical protein KC731_29430 [Myxococcales bacterium]|nr:hypothetical protein [Myxococcales bacterium]